MIKIADFHYQSQRLWGRFLNATLPEKLDGKYDIIFVHREIEGEGEIEKVIPYCNPNTKIIVDITTESGQIELFLERFKKIIEKYNYEFILISDLPINQELNCSVIDDYSLAFLGHLHDNIHSRTFFHHDNRELAHGIVSYNGSLRTQRLWLNYFCSKAFKRSRLIKHTHLYFWYYLNKGEGPKFYQEDFNQMVSTLPNEEIQKVLHEKFRVHHHEEHRLLQEDWNDLKYLEHTVNLISENVTGLLEQDDKNHISFTEKTIKPLVRGQIPLIHGYRGLQDELRKLGFDLYDDFVDHSYEKETDEILRIEKIVQEAKRLTTCDTEEFLNNNQHRVYNNKKLCEELLWKGKSLIIKLIDEILQKK